MAIGVNREHGPYRRPVGGSRTVVSSPTTSRWARATVAGHARGAERSLLGSTHGCSLARFAVSLSVLSGLSSTLPTPAAQRVADSLAAKTCRRFTNIDARFRGAKKGAVVSALQNAAKAAKSWQSQTAMVFLSRCTWPALPCQTAETNPGPASVYADGNFVGSTPASLKLSPGEHHLRVAMDGYKEWTQTVAAQTGAEGHITANLEKQKSNAQENGSQ